jgi:hypothetical protein
MENLEKQINLIVSEELETKEFSAIHSVHEGCAFIQNVFEETLSDAGILLEKRNALWNKTKQNCATHELSYEAKMVKAFAISVAVDAIRVAVIAEKLLAYLEEREGDKVDEG